MHQFESLDPIKLETPFDKFNSAKFLLGVHGAALTGLVFCRSKMVFCEIQSRSHGFPYFQSLAISAGLETHLLRYGKTGPFKLHEKVYGSSMKKKEVQNIVGYMSDILSDTES